MSTTNINIPKPVIDYNDLLNQPTLVTEHSQLNLDDGTNPHGTTKSDVGLGNVPNLDTTNAVNKAHDAVTLTGTPNYLTIAGQVITRALIDLASHVTNRLAFSNLPTGTARSIVGRAGSGNGDVGNISAGNNTILGRYGSGDVAFNSATETKEILSLSNVDNTSDLDKPISTATQTALNNKQDTLVSGTNIKTINGNSILGSGDIVVGGGSSSVNVLSLETSQGTVVTGTTSATISRSIFIPANTLNVNSYLNILARYERIGSNGSITMDLWKNTINSLTGSTKIGSCGSMSTTNRIASIQRNLWIDSNLLYFLPNGVNTQGDNPITGNFVWATTTFDTSVDNYILVAVTLANIADIGVVKSLLVTSYE